MHLKTTHLIKRLKQLLLLSLSFLSLEAIAGAIPADTPSLSPVLERTIPAVVHIASIHNNPNPEKSGHSQGSGVIVDAKRGFVLTNWHVIKGADELLVMLDDKRQVHAKLIGGDPPTDVALIQIPPDNLQAFTIGNSDQLKVGDYVLAIGNPFGLSQTVTSGIVSALSRSELGIEGYEDFIQTDASINPGNSGGALINLKGELVGLNTAIAGPTGASVGLGFAIPINMAHNIMEQLIKYGEVRRGLLGLSAQTLTPDLAKGFQVKATEGAIITVVMPDSPALKGGLKTGDIVTAMNGRPIRTANELRNRLSLTGINEQVKLDILRQGKPQTLALTVESPETHQTALAKIDALLSGMEVRPFDDILPNQGTVKGLQIISLQEAAPLTRFGIRPFDIVTHINQQPVTSIQELSNALSSRQDPTLLRVVRGPMASYVVVP